MRAFVALLAVGSLLLAGCGGPSMSAPEQDAEGRYLVELTNANRFLPSKFSVPANATILFTVTGSTPHDVQVTGPESFSSGDPGQMRKGDSFPVHFTKPGKYSVFCHLHHGQGMQGTITVTEAASE